MEGGVDWDPKEFTMIRVESEKKNARGETIAYDLMPLRYGTPRHNERFTQHDLWVSRAHPERPMEYLFINLPKIVKDEEAGRAGGHRPLVQFGRAPRAPE